ncbi:Transposable element P transposase [Frankliniella fusca]|uniref:Transposable element P transposase n=1 Tax=Frankliniella fusca TaxID=407009 RepID=A0AAE1L5R9_9NEOP|nr:Transposable element P transposase [Frankliniella fusca]
MNCPQVQLLSFYSFPGCFMAPRCCAPLCSNSHKSGHSLITFPKDLTRRQLWIKAIGRENWTPKSHERICEIHFKPTDWIDRTSSHKLLKSSAVPTLLCRNETCLSQSEVVFPSPGIILITPSNHAHHHSSSCAVAISESLKEAHDEVPPPSTTVSSRCLKLMQANANLQSKVSVLSREVKEKGREIMKCDKKILGLSQAANRREEWLESKFGKDQLQVAASGNSRGVQWSIGSVDKALSVRLSGGSGCVKTVSDTVCPLPSVRTIQRRTQSIKFQPGLLHEFLEPFKEKVLPTFTPEDKDCTLHFDEMSIKSQRNFDPGTGHYFGGVTLEGIEGLASKLEVFTFAGLQRKWKLNSAYHCTPAEGCTAPRAKVVLDLLQYGEESGLNCVALVCDMGNRGLLAELGFNTTRDKRKFSITHPFNSEKILCVVPDVVHVFKSIKEMLVNNKEICISSDIASRFELPTTQVELSFVELLVDFQEDNMDCRFAPRLTRKDLSKSHFNKMNTASACHIFGDKTAAALDFLADEKVFDSECKTTAWFIKLINKWFSILSSRSIVKALSLKNREAYDEAICVLQLVIEVFSTLSVGNNWKPVQTHVIMATAALIQISSHLLFVRKYDFVFMGRFTNDISENIFSDIRRSRPTPTALEAKYALKMQTLSQCTRRVMKSQYAHDDRKNLMSLQDILEYSESKKFKPAPSSEPLPWTEPLSFETSTFKDVVLYRMCGYLLHSMRKSGQLSCDSCFENLQHQGDTPLSLAKWTVMTDFKENAQIQVSAAVYRLLQAIEFNINIWTKDILKLEANATTLVYRSVVPALSAYDIPSCLSCLTIKEKIVKRFIVMRLKQIEKTPLEERPAHDSSFASKSMAYRVLATNYRGKRRTEGSKFNTPQKRLR